MATKKLVQLPAILTGMNSRSDGSWKLVYETRVLSGDELTTLGNAVHGEGWLVFSPNEVDVSDVPDTPAESESKTPSQRYRSKLYILWKQKGSKGDFDSYYRTVYQRLDEALNEQLEDK